MGYYCPQGSSKPVSCDGGKYCETPGLESPTGENLTDRLICLILTCH
jgi:hypothetical protein